VLAVFPQFTIVNATSKAKICQTLIVCRIAASSNKSLHLTANSSAVFEMLCPASRQVVIQGSVSRSVGGR